VRVRFLHLRDRTVGAFEPPLPPLAAWRPEALPGFRLVPSLQAGGRLYQPWQEAVERDVAVADTELGTFLDRPSTSEFGFPASRALEPISEATGEVAGVLAREQQAVAGAAELTATEVADGLFRLSVSVHNCTRWEVSGEPDRDAALLRTLVSTHVILGVQNGAFVSLTDPPAERRPHAEACQNVGAWPVLVGEEGERDTLLASPIILPDYPQVAPESPGDLFDATEVDEILSLRILTLTDEEKQQVAAVDERARALLQRTEALTPEQMQNLHGTIRLLRPVGTGDGDGGLRPVP
jgi:hydrogenase maturation protease